MLPIPDIHYLVLVYSERRDQSYSRRRQSLITAIAFSWSMPLPTLYPLLMRISSVSMYLQYKVGPMAVNGFGSRKSGCFTDH